MRAWARRRANAPAWRFGRRWRGPGLSREQASIRRIISTYVRRGSSAARSVSTGRTASRPLGHVTVPIDDAAGEREVLIDFEAIADEAVDRLAEELGRLAAAIELMELP